MCTQFYSIFYIIMHSIVYYCICSNDYLYVTEGIDGAHTMSEFSI